jgi:antagonist of KipI
VIQTLKAPPFATVQDLGRSGYRTIGVPLSGAMDRWGLTQANLLVGNSPDAAALEWALGGGVITSDVACTIAIAGAIVEADGERGGGAVGSVFRLGKGAQFEIHRLVTGRFAYVAVSGGLEVPRVLGSRSTYVPALLGGLDGRLLRNGDSLPVGSPARDEPATTRVETRLEPDYQSQRVRVIPAEDGVIADVREKFFATEFTVSLQSDRIGYRLDGARLSGFSGATLSVPVCPGTIQLPPGGEPIVLMADAPTVGGYPVVGVVCSVDLPIVAQKSPGERITFEPITVAAAQAALTASC